MKEAEGGAYVCSQRGVLKHVENGARVCCPSRKGCREHRSHGKPGSSGSVCSRTHHTLGWIDRKRHHKRLLLVVLALLTMLMMLELSGALLALLRLLELLR